MTSFIRIVRIAIPVLLLLTAGLFGLTGSNSLATSSYAAQLKCGQNYKKVGGKCVLKQNCGANAYRSAEGDCYCKKNYMMSNGKCIWKQKNGFEVKPWEKPGCTIWQSQCNQGSPSGCANYEANCQVN
jgi:uncharacterized low-complexity protein